MDRDSLLLIDYEYLDQLVVGFFSVVMINVVSRYSGERQLCFRFFPLFLSDTRASGCASYGLGGAIFRRVSVLPILVVLGSVKNERMGPMR